MLKKKVARLRDFDVVVATSIVSEINDGPMSAGAKLELSSAVGKTLAGGDETTTGRAEVRGNQHCLIELFLTRPQWERLSDTSLPVGPNIGFFRDSVLAPLRLYCPSEAMKGRVANLLRHVALPLHALRSPDDWQEFLSKVRAGLQPLTKVKSKDAHVFPYPPDPSTLQEEWPEVYERVYATEPPENREVAELGGGS